MARLALVGSLLIAAQAHATSVLSESDLIQSLQADLKTRTQPEFEPILKKWESLYKADAVSSLLTIASDSKMKDSDRYIALTGAARLGGKSVAPRLAEYLKDESWMVRSASLRALAELGDPKYGKHVSNMLHDPALVVRMDAVEAVTKLKPKTAIRDLASVLSDPENYHKGVGLWVPQKALSALETLSGKKSDPTLPWRDRIFNLKKKLGLIKSSRPLAQSR